MAATYSVWVEPEGVTPFGQPSAQASHAMYMRVQSNKFVGAGALADRLHQEIGYLADAYGGPTFPPHVTLVGSVNGSEAEVVKSAHELAANLKVCTNMQMPMQWQQCAFHLYATYTSSCRLKWHEATCQGMLVQLNPS